MIKIQHIKFSKFNMNIFFLKNVFILGATIIGNETLDGSFRCVRIVAGDLNT